ncbi:peroxisomal biogenesis factor 2 [Xylocopa sonorina]|uniref:peroxisomal biogenesis factor 2 n=1 Tax=Xylocopa sonorina TaxID=1818115 RepID=UPI00403B073E
MRCYIRSSVSRPTTRHQIHSSPVTMASNYVSRINQIDAASLDQEIYKVLRNQAKRVTRYQPIEKIDRYQPEIDAILKYCIWNYSLRHGNSTFGQQLLNLHYENITSAKSILYLILTIGPAYVKDRLSECGAGSNLTLYVERIANALKLLEFLNLLWFLNRGIQPGLIEYLLGIASRSKSTHKPRNIGYSYMTRELLWHSLMELFTTGLPMLNFHYLKHAIKRLLAYTKKRDDDAQRRRPTMDRSTKCAYCGDTPIHPVHAGCEHIFCYYCLAAHFTAMDEFRCFQCDAPLWVRNMTAYEPRSSQFTAGIREIPDASP